MFGLFERAEVDGGWFGEKSTPVLERGLKEKELEEV